MPRKYRSTPGPYLVQVELLRDRIPDGKRFPYNLPAVRHLQKLLFHPRVTFLVGENGTGKSTLLEALAVACGLNPVTRGFLSNPQRTLSALFENTEKAEGT